MSDKTYECPKCGYLITAEMLAVSAFDYSCPRCGKAKISGFQESFILQEPERISELRPQSQQGDATDSK